MMQPSRRGFLAGVLAVVATSATGAKLLIPKVPQTVRNSAWLLCNGQAISRSKYSALFAMMGEVYGRGDGATTFSLPDYRMPGWYGADDVGPAEVVTYGINAENDQHNPVGCMLPFLVPNSDLV